MNKLIQGSAHALPEIPTESIHMIVTSPPYYWMRKYEGEQQVAWPAVSYSPMINAPCRFDIPAMTCDLGQEPTLEAYIGHLVLCLREWWRVLRKDGTLWPNLGDSSAGSGGSGGDYNVGGLRAEEPRTKGAKPPGLKAKNICMVPQRFALAAQAEGWFVRNEIIWVKDSPGPQNVTDRPTRAHEQIYLLSKSPRYYYDNDPVNPNDRDVWRPRPTPYGGSHYATFPEDIPAKAIRAGTSAAGCCPTCGKGWTRVVERSGGTWEKRKAAGAVMRQGMDNKPYSNLGRSEVKDIGWTPGCKCAPLEPVPCTVLDPFSGSGTTGRVATRLGRDYIGVDISAKYLTQLTPARLANVQMEMSF
jgi:DNA modification methylase